MKTRFWIFLLERGQGRKEYTISRISQTHTRALFDLHRVMKTEKQPFLEYRVDNEIHRDTLHREERIIIVRQMYVF